MKLSVEKRSGVLLHPTSLPGGHGIGDLGPESYKFIDHLSDMGQSLWQVLPLGPTDQFNSPYSSISTFAGNHLLISLDLLVEANLLNASAIKTKPSFNSNRVNFKDVIAYKAPLLKQASKDFNTKASADMKSRFDDFKENNSYWLDMYSLFCAKKEANQHRPWTKWKKNNLDLKEYVDEVMVLQFLFHDQWQSLHNYCKAKGVQVIGDMPIYVDHDSSDVYSNRHLFNLDDNGKMIYQSGAPPCDFQKNGQLWGTPVYNWDKHKEEQYKWWIQRFKKLFEMVDIIRLDHFIGYAKFYRILTKNKTAVNGEWIKGPGANFFDTILGSIKTFNVIVEDLGDATQDVVELRDKYRFPGMKVFQFEADSMQHSKDCDSNTFFCTGTHDNNTIMGWFKSLPKQSSDHNKLSQNSLLNFFNCNIKNIHWKIIDYSLMKSSKYVVIPMQDLFAEDSRARFNLPGTLSNHNWSWRMKPNQLTSSIKNKLADLTKNIRN